MCRNVQLINQFYPDWKIYIMCGKGVPEDIMKVLSEQKNVIIKQTGREGGVNMHFRFFILDLPEVDIMIVRDADSRIHARDRWCIDRWLASSKGAMLTRDHKFHTNKIMGGLWGVRKGCLPDKIKDIYGEFLPIVLNPSYEFEYGNDQDLISENLYPLLVKDAIVFTDIDKLVYEGEYHEKIEFPMVGDNFCGQVADFNDKGEEIITIPYFHNVDSDSDSEQ